MKSMHGLFRVGALAWVVCFAQALWAEEGGKLPDAKAVIEKYLKATGGAEKLGTLKNRVAKGSFVLLDMGVEAEFTDYTVPPNKYTEIFLGAFGTSERGYIDGVAWEVSPAEGPRILEGYEAADLKRQGSLSPLLHWEKDFKSAEVKGKKAINGTDCYELVLTPHEGPAATNYFAVDSGLLVQLEIPVRESGNAVTTFSDYREVDGMKLPFKIGMAGGKYRVEIVLSSIEHNAEIPADRMKLPQIIADLKK